MLLLLCVLIGRSTVAESPASAPPVVVDAALQVPPAEVAPETPPYRGLDANLYMQISAEYRACCLQAFHWARRLTTEKLAAGDLSNLPPAVVLDLDETVLDNAFFQSAQIRANASFDMARWAKWETGGTADVKLVPGAKDFIKFCQSINVQPIYITNRNAAAHDQTLEALKRFDIAVSPDLLLCATDETGSDKTSRRASVQSRFNILLYVGDGLRDFDEEFKYSSLTGSEGRKQTVDAKAEQFGIDWIVLPNPAYGEWAKGLEHAKSDVNMLAPPVAEAVASP